MKAISLHYRSFIYAFIRIVSNPLEHILNITVLSLIIAILSSVLVINRNSHNWQENNLIFPQITIYLNINAKDSDISNIEATINRYSQNQKLVKNYQFISKEQGLSELKQDPQLKNIASDVITDGQNPLPNILIVNTNTANIKALDQLNNRIKHIAMVDSVEMDTNYAGKVDNLINFVKRVGGFSEILFGIVLVLVVYNMIRLQMLIRQDEITVSRLIGASNSFIMRPLIYYATIQVTIGVLIAFALVNWFINLLNNLFVNLDNLFGRDFMLSNLSYQHLIGTIVILDIFAIFAVFLAVHWVFRNSYTK